MRRRPVASERRRRSDRFCPPRGKGGCHGPWPRSMAQTPTTKKTEWLESKTQQSYILSVATRTVEREEKRTMQLLLGFVASAMAIGARVSRATS